MEYDLNGVYHLGVDGVLRSFSHDNRVVDYRQLDPEQVKSLASGLVAQFDYHGIEIDEAFRAMAAADEKSEVDGRLVTDLQLLLHPTDPLNFPSGRSQPQSSPNPNKDVVDRLEARQPVYCGVTCWSLPDCYWVYCHACFFPSGTGRVGACFLW